MDSVRGQLEYELAKLVSWSDWLSSDLAADAIGALESREVVSSV